MMNDTWHLYFDFGSLCFTARMNTEPCLHVKQFASMMFLNLNGESCLKDRYGLLSAQFYTNEQLLEIIKIDG